MKSKEPQDHQFNSKVSIIACPKCPKNPPLTERWLVRKADSIDRVRPKLTVVFCEKCGYNLGSIKQPKQSRN